MKNNVRKSLKSILGSQGGKTGGNRSENSKGIWDERQSGMYDPARIVNDAFNRLFGPGGSPGGGAGGEGDLPDWLKKIHAGYESGRVSQQSPAATLGSKIGVPAATPKIRPDGWRPDGFRQLTEALKQGWLPGEAHASGATGSTIATANNPAPIEPSRDYKPGDVTPMRRLVQRLQNPDSETTGHPPAFNSLRDLAENMKQRAESAIATSFGIEAQNPGSGNSTAGISQTGAKRNTTLGTPVSKQNANTDMLLYGDQSWQDGDSNLADGIINVSTGSASEKKGKSDTPVVDDNWKPTFLTSLRCNYSDSTECKEYNKKKLGWLFKNNYAQFQEDSANTDSRYVDLQKVVRKAHEYTKDNKAPLKDAVKSAIAYFPEKLIENVYNYANSPLSAPNISMMEQDYLAWEQNSGANPSENRHMYDQFTGFPWEKFQNSKYAKNHKLPLKAQIKEWITENTKYWKTVELKSLGWKKEDLDAYNEFVDLASGVLL